jgi:hypothetical protein
MRRSTRCWFTGRAGRFRRMISFSSCVVIEGAAARGDKRNRRIGIPAATVRELENSGTLFPCWLRFAVKGKTFFAFARRTKSRSSVDVALPVWHFGRLAAGTVLKVSVEDAEPYRARPAASKQFDWLLYQTRDEYFATDVAGAMTVYYRREPLTLQRLARPELLYWLLGFYQAEGSKKADTEEWGIVSVTPALLRAVIDALLEIGIPKSRMHLDVLHAPGDDPKAAKAVFSKLGVPVRKVYQRIKHKKWKSSGGRGAVLRVERSRVLYRLTDAALQAVFKDGGTFPSAVSARAYAIGWLDGDGTFHPGKERAERTLNFCGTLEEIAVCQRALTVGLGWPLRQRGYRNFTAGRGITLEQTAQLAAHGAFRFSMNRARLLFALIRGNAITSELADEAAELIKYVDPATRGCVGIKCAPYPAQLHRFSESAFNKEKPRSDN